jgi:hypothetical protein
VATSPAAFYPGSPSHYQPEIDRGLGDAIVDMLLDHLDPFLSDGQATDEREEIEGVGRRPACKTS